MNYFFKLLKITLVIYVLYLVYLILFTLNSVLFLSVFSVLVTLLLSVLFKTRRSPFSPKFIISFWFLVSYVFPLAFLINQVESNYLLGDKSMYSNVAILTESMIVVLIAYVGVLLATNIRLKKTFVLWKKTINRISKGSLNYLIIIICFVWFVLSYFLRKEYQLGVAGSQPIITSYAGVLQYLLFNGNIVILSYLFIYCFKNKKKYLFPVLLVAFTLIASQALLGWRGDVIKILLLLVSLFYFVKISMKKINNKLTTRKKSIKISKKYVYISLILIPLMINMGDLNRSEKIGRGFQETSILKYLTKFMLRGQGLTRLIYVVNEEDSSFSLTNNFFFLKLEDMSSINYIDRKLYNIDPKYSNSTGGGGIGNSYLSMGLLGVFFTYFMIALVYHVFYNRLINMGLNPFLVVCYGQMMMLLPNYIMENTGLFMLKEFLVIILLSYFYGVLINKKA